MAATGGAAIAAVSLITGAASVGRDVLDPSTYQIDVACKLIETLNIVGDDDGVVIIACIEAGEITL